MWWLSDDLKKDVTRWRPTLEASNAMTPQLGVPFQLRSTLNGCVGTDDFKMCTYDGEPLYGKGVAPPPLGTQCVPIHHPTRPGTACSNDPRMLDWKAVSLYSYAADKITYNVNPIPIIPSERIRGISDIKCATSDKDQWCSKSFSPDVPGLSDPQGNCVTITRNINGNASTEGLFCTTHKAVLSKLSSAPAQLFHELHLA